MLLDREDPRRVLYRSSRPVLVPRDPGEQEGIVSNVVFPTAVDVRGQRIDVYYGAADARIAAATTQINASLLLAPSAPPEAAIPQPGVISGHAAPAGGASRGGREDRKRETGMQVKDIMTQPVEVVPPTATLDEAARRMREVDIGMLPVLDGAEVVGVVTDRDLAVRAIAQGLDPKTATVEEVMTAQVHYCFDDQSVEEAAATMADTGLRRLVVLDRAMRLTGIVSLDDVAVGAENLELAGETLEQTVSRPDRMHGRYERILVALDGSALAERVFTSIEPLAQQFGSRVILLRVLTPAHVPGVAEGAEDTTSASRPAAGADPTAADAARREAMRYLTAVQQRLAAQGLTVQSECPEGPPGEMILRRARQLGADLIALTTHGRTGIDRLLLGSVAEDVVRRAPCPVHLVRVRSGQ
jgi:CBS domain-containing protein/nucleotide-binding universal stress UspA family protein